jgi:hypothetical protein
MKTESNAFATSANAAAGASARTVAAAAWPDSLPALYRSEAFAEDLDDSRSDSAVAAGTGARLSGWASRSPLLGVVLAPMLGWLGG